MAQAQNRISIIMPAKNTARFLAECIHSICNQTYDNWELIAVNDHSSDHTPEILKEFSGKDPRIRAVKNNGTGIIDALKTGYDLTTGDFITRMDSDDRMAESKLRTMANQLTEYGKGYIATGLVSYFSDGILGDGYKKYENWLNGLSKTGKNFDDLYRECPIPSPCWMVHRSDFELAGGFASHRYPEDYDLCFRFHKAGLKILPAKKVLHYWRDHHSRASRNHPNYADNRFLDLKMHYFARLHYNSDMQLLLWGAGKKAKIIARYFIEHEIQFVWLTNNHKKIGKEIYGKILESCDGILLNTQQQLVLTMANTQEQEAVNSTIKGTEMKEMKNFFWFC